MKCRFMILALCTGYHPFGEFGERIDVLTVDGTCHNLRVPMIPLRASIVVTVRELVPYNSDIVDEFCKQSGNQFTKLDIQNASVLLQDQHSRKSHKFVAVPICQQQLLRVHDVISGLSFSTCCDQLQYE